MSNAAHILTFDLEEWFYLYSWSPKFQSELHWKSRELRAEAITLTLLELLYQSDGCATFFTMGRFAKQYPHLIKKIHQAGHEIGAHSNEHIYAHQQSLGDFEEDLHRNIELLTELTGDKVASYRTPAYSIDTLLPAYRDVFIRQGIKYDSSMKSGNKSCVGIIPNEPFKINDGTELVGFPVSCWPYLGGIPYGGSGFFRLLPHFLVEKKLNQAGYHMLYFHPRDFDVAMYKLPDGPYEKIKYGIGTESMHRRLEALLSQFKMSSIAAYQQNTNTLPMQFQL